MTASIRSRPRAAIVGTNIPGGSAVVGKQLAAYLHHLGMEVDFYDFNLHVLRKRRSKSDAEKDGQDLAQQAWGSLAERIRIRDYAYVFPIERGDILLFPLGEGCKTIYLCQSPLSHERYYERLAQGDPAAEEKLTRDLEHERNIYSRADVVTFAWNTYESFIREHVYDEGNICSHPGLGWYGCQPQTQKANYAKDINLIYLGHIANFSNPDLLARLTTGSPHPIDCYGPLHFPLETIHHGGIVTDEWETMRRYQFGLNTVSTDPLRKAGFSSKVLAYLSLGLPCFSPEWQVFSHQVAGVVAYTEGNFNSLVEENHAPNRWRALSDAAYQQARQLDWRKVFEPLKAIL